MSATATSVSCSAVWSLTAQNARSGVSRAVLTYSSNVKPSVRRTGGSSESAPHGTRPMCGRVQGLRAIQA